MTEAEAKKKWCPFARVHTGINGSTAAANRNLLSRDEGKANCIGSACMAWQQSDVAGLVGRCAAMLGSRG